MDSIEDQHLPKKYCGLDFLKVFILVATLMGIRQIGWLSSFAFEEPTRQAKHDAAWHCKLVIDNGQFGYHFEILESVVADFPLVLPEPCGNHLSVDLTFDLKESELSPRARGYVNYLRDNVQGKVYVGYRNQQRTLDQVYFQKKRADYNAQDPEFIAYVYSSAYCRPRFLNELNSNKTYAIFHERCAKAEVNSRSYWVTPNQRNHIFPNRLPQFNTTDRVSIPPYKLCVIGKARRRNFGFFRSYFESSAIDDFRDRFQILIFGMGSVPGWLSNFTSVKQDSTADFYDFQRRVAMNCDALVALLDSATKSEYFPNVSGSSQKLSGAITQASAYKLPIVIHEDLASLYAEYLKQNLVVTHSDNVSSFKTALHTMLHQLDLKVQ